MSGVAYYRHVRLLLRVVTYLLVVTGAVVVLIPFAWMLSSSLKPQAQVFSFPPQWIPHPVVWKNYLDAFGMLPFGRYFANTAYVTAFSMVGQVLTSAMVAFGFARLRFPGRDPLFILVLATMMVPYQVTIIPEFIIFRTLGWINTYKPLIIPAFFGGGAFFIFLLRQFFLTIPREFDEAARIDGCTTYQIFWAIILPMAKPALGVVAIFSFMGTWNDFLRPLIYINSMELRTISLGLNAIRGLYSIQWNLVMAVSTVALLPCLLLFFFFQRLFIQGIVITGIKG